MLTILLITNEPFQSQEVLPVEAKTEIPKDDITIGPIPQEYVQQVQQQQGYPTETDLEQQQQHHAALDEHQRQALAGHYQHVAGAHPHLLAQQMGDLSQQQQQPGQPALMTPVGFINYELNLSIRGFIRQFVHFEIDKNTLN